MLARMQEIHEPLPAAHPCHGCKVRTIAVGHALDCADLGRMRLLGGTKRLAAGETLFHEGDAANRVYTLTKGALKLYKLLADGRRQVTGFMFPGDFLGASVDDEHAFTVEALCESELCSYPRGRFDGFVAEHQAVERELYRMAIHELAAARRQMVLLGRKTAIERLATFFLDLLARAERLEDGPVRLVQLAMARSDIADYLGLTKETVSRVISLLRRQRLIRLAALDAVEILDRPAMAALAEGAGTA